MSTSDGDRPARARAPRNTLSRARVVAAAVEVADANGLAGLTIRSLASHLGVGPMAIYHHVANKDEILDLIVDAVFEEVDSPRPGEPWRAGLHLRSVSIRDAMRRHPWALGLVDSRTSPGPATLADHEAVLGALLEDGFAPAAAGRAYALLDSHVYGFTLQESNLPIGDGLDDEDLARAMLATIDRERYPHLLAFAEDQVLRPGYAFGNEFEPTLELVLGVVEQLRGA